MKAYHLILLYIIALSLIAKAQQMPSIPTLPSPLNPYLTNESGNQNQQGDAPHVQPETTPSPTTQQGQTGKSEHQDIDISIEQRIPKHNHEDYMSRVRDALRGNMLYEYYYGQSNDQDNGFGYVKTTREGKDSQGNYCREIESFLVQGFQNFTERHTYCLYNRSEWVPTLPSDVQFSSGSGASSGSDSHVGPRPPQLPGAGGGGWLPPVMPRPRN